MNVADIDPSSSKEPPRETLDAYLAEADSWARDRRDALRRSRKVAWIIASASAAVAFMEAIALLLLIPLKQVVPYTLLVDRQTGYVQLLKPLNPELVSSDTALTQSFLVQYVIAREGFDINSVQTDYRKVALWSGGQARADYLAQMQASNPSSPLARYPRSTLIEVRAKSVSTIGKNAAMVRFDTVRYDAVRQPASPQPWVAIIRYSYSGEPLSVGDRFVNPLGFKVLTYRRSPEALPTDLGSSPPVAVVPRPSYAPRYAPGSGALQSGAAVAPSAYPIQTPVSQ